MNRERRRKLLLIVDEINSINSMLSDLIDAEEECLDNIPDNLKESERCEQMQETIDCLLNAGDHLDNAAEEIVGAI